MRIDSQGSPDALSGLQDLEMVDRVPAPPSRQGQQRSTIGDAPEGPDNGMWDAGRLAAATGSGS